MKSKSAGFALVGAIALSMSLLILVTAMVYWVQQESRVSVKQKKSTTAFHLAEAAVDRSRWKLQESNTVWQDTGNGIYPTGYKFDKKYTDLVGGQYSISISSTASNKDRRIVIGVGRDDSTKEVRRIYAEFEREGLNSTIYSGGEVDIDGASTEVHWGPIKAQEEIDYSTKRFPRLYARLRITPEPPYCNSTSCPAKTDNVQYWAFYDVPPRPVIDFDALKSSAQANGTYFNTPQDWNNAYPGGSCTGCPAGVSTKLDKNLIWYFDLEGVGSERLKLRGGKYIYGTIIVMGKLELEGDGRGEYFTTPPSQAWQEYKVIDTSAADEWYGDAGGGPPSAVSTSFEFRTGGATPAKRDGIKQGVSLRGFAYGKEEFDAQGNNVVHGMIIIEIDEVDNAGNVLVFYDENAAANVPVTLGKVALKVWREEPGTWPSGL